MRGRDARGWRVAVVPDALLNPASPLLEAPVPGAEPARALLEARGWGLVVAPPHMFGEAAVLAALDLVAQDVHEYRRFEYEVVFVGLDPLPGLGLWSEALGEALVLRGQRGLDPLHVVDAGDLGALERFLDAHTVADAGPADLR